MLSDFKKSTIYQIYIRSFKDSDNDGFGDLGGIIEKLDYLKDLGVDYLWLTPFFVSPQRDNGYDIANYLEIDSRFGTMEDFETLVEEADKRGLGIMLDMVFNHTSTEHEWFKRALSGDPKYLDYYIFKDGTPDDLPTNWVSKFGGPAWQYVDHLKKWYLHLFDVTQADLNWENPDVREALKNVIRFWKNKGVRGFRFDVVNLISKPEIYENDTIGDGRRFYTDGRHVHEFLKELVHDTGIDTMITVGEMSSTSIDNCIRYTNPAEKELSMCFNFHHLKVDYKNGNKWDLMPPDYTALKRLFEDWQLKMQSGDGWNALFWSNHDQPRVVSRFGDDKNFWRESATMLSTFTHLLRGTPYIYQGEEIGMTNPYFASIDQYRDVESLNYYQILLDEGKTPDNALSIIEARSRDNGRTPMQWNADAYAGFSSCKPWIDIPDNYQYINVASEVADPDSVLNYHKQLIALRKNHPAISDGQIAFIDSDNLDVFAYRRYTKDESICVFCNLTNHKTTVNTFIHADSSVVLLSNYPTSSLCSPLTLRPYEALVLQIDSKSNEKGAFYENRY